jgi:hypothetical protein
VSDKQQKRIPKANARNAEFQTMESLWCSTLFPLNSSWLKTVRRKSDIVELALQQSLKDEWCESSLERLESVSEASNGKKHR